MTYIEHERDCKIFKDDRLEFGGGVCNCSARYARAPQIMGPHEEHCPYLEQLKGMVPHGICYCSAHPDHDDICTGMACWERRKGLTAPTDKVA